MTRSRRIEPKVLRHYCTELFIKAGVPKESASTVSESLIQANLRGVESHGVVRIPIYLERIQKGMINPHANIDIVEEGTSSVLIDGNNNLGPVIGYEALKIVLNKAKKSGIACAGVRGSNHFGTGAFYAMKAIEHDMILLVMSNASQTMPPTGGVRPFLGTNPLAVGVPAGREDPFVLDMATSVVARGKIIVAAQKGEKIPKGWAVDKEGNPTTDPHAALEGAVLPFGGPKGYAISMFIDILSGVLTGAGFGKYVNNMYENWNDPQNVGHFFVAINIENFLPLDVFKDRMDLYIREIKSEPKADGVDKILVPGELEFRKETKITKTGIEVSEELFSQLNNVGRAYNIHLQDMVV